MKEIRKKLLCAIPLSIITCSSISNCLLPLQNLSKSNDNFNNKNTLNSLKSVFELNKNIKKENIDEIYSFIEDNNFTIENIENVKNKSNFYVLFNNVSSSDNNLNVYKFNLEEKTCWNTILVLKAYVISTSWAAPSGLAFCQLSIL